MYYVPDDTKKCGYYECPVCGERFLDLQMDEEINCPYCENEVDLEVGPDEDINTLIPKAKLLEVVEGENVEMMDSLLSLAITGGNYDWI